MSSEELQIIFLTLRVAIVAVAISVVPAFFVASYLARSKGATRYVVENIVLLPLIVPPVVTGYLLLLCFSQWSAFGRFLSSTLGWTPAFTWIGAALAAAIVSFPLLVQPIRVAMEQIDSSWEEIVKLSGGGWWASMRYVVIPTSARGILAGVLLAFARAMGEFGATIVFAGNIPGESRTLPLAIFNQLSEVGGESSSIRLVGAAILISILSLVCYSLVLKKFYRANTN